MPRHTQGERSEQEVPIHPINQGEAPTHGAAENNAENNSGSTSRTSTADSSQSVLDNVADSEGSPNTTITAPDDHVEDAPPNDASVEVNAAPTTGIAAASSSAQSSVVPPNDAAPTHADLVEQINQLPKFSPEWFRLKENYLLFGIEAGEHAAASTSTTTANRAADNQTILEDVNLPSNNAVAGVHQDGPSRTQAVPSPASATPSSFVGLEEVTEENVPLQYLESSLFKDEDVIKTSSAQASLKMNWPPELIDADEHPPLPPDCVASSFEDDENANKKPAASKNGKKGQIEISDNNDAPMPSQQLEATFEEEETANQTAAAAQINMEVSQDDDAPVPLHYFEDSLDKENKFKKKAASNESTTPATVSSTASALTSHTQNREAQSSTPLPSNTPSQSSTLQSIIAPFQRMLSPHLSNAAPPLTPSAPPLAASEPNFYAVEATLVSHERVYDAVLVPDQGSLPVVPDQGSLPVLVQSRAKYKRCIFTGMAATFVIIGVTVGAIMSTISPDIPSMIPSDVPSMIPSDVPSMIPSDIPSMVPSVTHSVVPMLPAISSTSVDKVTVVSAPGKCMAVEPNTNNVYMSTCQDGDANQVFSYNATDRTIMHDGLCLDMYLVELDYLNATMHECNGESNQQWLYYPTSNQLKTLYDDDKCLDLNYINDLYMIECHSNTSQKFQLPSMWLPAISSSSVDRVTVVSAPGKCMAVEPNTNNVYMSTCQDGDANQVFSYNATDRTIMGNGLCLEYSFVSSNVYMFVCHGKSNQQWWYYPHSKALGTFYNDNCLYWDNINLDMRECYGFGDSNQEFQLPSMWLPAISRANLGETPCLYGSCGIFVYFDRYNVECPDGYALNGWTYTQDTCDACYGKIKYQCVPISAIGIKYTEQLACQHVLQNMDYLERHNIKCSAPGAVLNAFSLNHGSCESPNMAFQVTCYNLVLDQSTNCFYQVTAVGQSILGQPVGILEQYPISCNADEVLTSWSVHSYTQLGYTCCQNPPPNPSMLPSTTPST